MGGRKGASLCRGWAFEPYGLQDNYEIADGERRWVEISEVFLTTWQGF